MQVGRAGAALFEKATRPEGAHANYCDGGGGEIRKEVPDRRIPVPLPLGYFTPFRAGLKRGRCCAQLCWLRNCSSSSKSYLQDKTTAGPVERSVVQLQLQAAASIFGQNTQGCILHVLVVYEPMRAGKSWNCIIHLFLMILLLVWPTYRNVIL